MRGHGFLPCGYCYGVGGGIVPLDFQNRQRPSATACGVGRGVGGEAGFSAPVEMTTSRVGSGEVASPCASRVASAKMRGFFAALRMTSRNKQLQLQKQIPFGDDKQERQRHKATTTATATATATAKRQGQRLIGREAALVEKRVSPLRCSR